MKLVIALACLGAAAASVAPVIELNLAGIRPTFAVSGEADGSDKLHAVVHSSQDCKCHASSEQGVNVTAYKLWCQNKVTGQCEHTQWHNTCHEGTVDCRKGTSFGLAADQTAPESKSRSDLLTKTAEDAEHAVASESELTYAKKYKNKDEIRKVLDFAKQRARLTKVDRQIERRHDLGYTQPNGDKVRSVQDYTQRCAAGTKTSYKTCPFPVAKAWDHNQEQIAIKTRVFRVDLDGSSCNYEDPSLRSACGCTGGDAKTCLVGSVNFLQRSTYLFKYDAQDAAGNHAEQVVFALIIDDQDAPVIEWCGANQDTTNKNCYATDEKTFCADSAECTKDSEFRVPRGCAVSNEACTDGASIDAALCPKDETAWAFTNEREIVQAGSSWKLCQNFGVHDEVDTDLKQTALFDVQKKNEQTGAWEYQEQAFNAKFWKAHEVIDATKGSAEYLVTMKVCDNAGVYGKNSMSNCAQAVKAIKVVDTARPVIILHGELNPVTWTEDGKEKGGTYVTGEAHECNSQVCTADAPVECVQKQSECTRAGIHTDQVRFLRDSAWTKESGEALNAKKCAAFETYCAEHAHYCHGYELEMASGFDVMDTFLNPDKLGPMDVKHVNTVDGSKVAEYKVNYSLSDASGNAAFTKTRIVKVVDTIPPILRTNGDDGNVQVWYDRDGTGKSASKDTVDSVEQQLHDTHDSGADWVDPGATCTDMCDKGAITVESKWAVCPGGENAGSKDKALTGDKANWGKYVKSTGKDQQTPYDNLGKECDGLSGTGAKNKLLGTYIRIYRCSDAHGNFAWGSRKWEMIDNSRPRITLLGDGKETYDASHKVEYTDKGATCIDDVDGTLSSAVEVSGSVVDMSKVKVDKSGEVLPYKLRYDCQDKSGNQAEPVFRYVYVEDKSCPELKLKGEDVNYVEAGFDWEEPGYTATDDLDGDITKKVVISGDVVNTAAAFYHRRSCKDIKVNFMHQVQGTKPEPGFYYITVNSHRLKVYCDFDFDATYYVCDGANAEDPHYKDAKGAITCTKDAEASCAKLGLEKVAWSSDKQFDDALAIAEIGKFVHKFEKETDQYLCSTNDESKIIHWSKVPSMYEAGAKNEHGNPTAASRMAHDLISHAEVGKYVILYSVQDEQGNSECGGPKKRTVIVRDTLPPIISLHLKNKADNADTALENRRGKDGTDLIHIGHVMSAGLGSGKTSTRNSNSDKHTQNSNVYMAETTQSSSAWLVAAAASAVTGLALLGFSRREQVVAVEV